MNLKAMMGFVCIMFTSLTVYAKTNYKLYEIEGVYQAKCAGRKSSIDLSSVKYVNIYAKNRHSETNNFYVSSVKNVPYSSKDPLFDFDIPLEYNSSVGPVTISNCPNNGWLERSRQCLYRQTSSASYMENLLMAQRKIEYLAQDGSGNISNTITTNLSFTISNDKSINFSFQKIDSDSSENNESYQCILYK